MNYLKGLVAFAMVLIGFSTHAQTSKTVQGVLKDSLSRVVSGATVQLISGKDTASTSSSIGGIYTFNNFQGENFKLKVVSIGFEPFEKEYSFPAGESKMMVPSIVMMGIPNMLEEIVINGVVTVQVKGDTIEYSTKDLKLRDGSVAEDALKKLQGVDVDKDGNVTAQGESVTRVRINGKDFFGGDVKTATQNLPANIIEKIKIVDDYGDMAALTGNKSGESSKVIDIQIDPKYNNGYAGMLRIGGGTEERFQTTGSWFQFKDKTQVSVLGNLNNMNAQLFDFNSMGGGARGRQGGGGRGPGGGMFGGSEGITQTGSIGVNLKHEFNEKVKVDGSYSYGRDDNSTLSNSLLDYIGQAMREESEKDNNSIRANHRFESNLEWKLSDKDFIKISPQFGFNDNDANNSDVADVFLNNLFNNNQIAKEISGTTTPRYNISGLYNRRLNEKGRNIFFNFNYDNANTQSDFDQIFERNVTDPTNADLTIPFIYEKTKRDVENKSWNAGASISYLEPLSDKSKLEITYDFNNNDYDNTNKQDAFNKDGSSLVSDILNYNYNYDYAFTTHKVGASFLYENDKIKYSLGAAVQPSVLKGDASSTKSSAVIDRSNFNIIPIARFEYKFSRQSNITVNYSGRSSEPGVSQILPFEVATTRTMTTLGNPELDPEFRHSMNVRFRSGDFQKGKTFFAMLRSELTQDKIVSMNRRFVVDEVDPTNPSKKVPTVYQEVGYQNENDAVYSINSFYHIGRSLKEKTYNIMYGGGVSLNKNISYVNMNETGGVFDKNNVFNTNISQMLFLRYNPSENLEINPGVRYNYSITNSNMPNGSRNTQKITPNIIGSVNITPSFIFGADVSKEFNKGFGNSANPFIVNTYVEKRFLKENRGTLRLQAFDLLNEQTNINRTVTDFLITDSQTNRLARYFMLTFTFKLQKFSGINPLEGSNMGPGGMRPPRM